MQQGRGGIGSHKHGLSGHAGASARLRLMEKLAAERGEYSDNPRRNRERLTFETVREALRDDRKPR